MGRKNFNAFLKNPKMVKKQKEEKKRKKREEKKKKKEARKEEDSSGVLEDMLAYVDEYGNIVDEPPEDVPDLKLKKKDQSQDED